jgi:cold-inducible RNA-binding protein
MNKKLYVGNLPFTAEAAQLTALFGSDGRQVVSVNILIDKMTGRSRGFGFIEMATPEDAEKALQALHGHEFMGRPLTVTEAREQAPRTGGPRPGFGRSAGGPGGNNFDRAGGHQGDRGGYSGGGDRGGYQGGRDDRGGSSRGFGGGYGGGQREVDPGPPPPSTGRGERGDRKRNRGGYDD